MLPTGKFEFDCITSVENVFQNNLLKTVVAFYEKDPPVGR